MIDFTLLFPHSPEKDVFKNLPRLEWNSILQSSSFEEEGRLHPFVVTAGRSAIGTETVVSPFVVIEDDVVIGKNCLIRSGALIRSGTVIENNCIIGHNAEIKNSYICEGAKIQGNTFVGDSIIGKGARIGTGCVTGNRRFDQKEIEWHMPKGKIKSGIDKLGLLLGDYARLGANVTTNPGTVIGAYTWVTGGISVSGHIPARKFVKLTGEIVDNTQSAELTSFDKQGNL